MTLRATLEFQVGCTIFSYDGRKAFKSMYWSKILPAVACIALDLVEYAGNVYARSPPIPL